MSPKVKSVINIVKYLFALLVLLFLLLVAAVNFPFVHTLITKKANQILAEKKIPVHIGKATLLLNGKIGITQLEIIKPGADTVTYAGRTTVDVCPVPLFSKKLVIKSIQLSDVVANILTDSVNREMNIISVFKTNATEQKKPEIETVNTQNTKPWEIIVENVQLKNIRVQYSDPAGGILVRQKIEKADIDFDTFSLLNKQIDVGNAEIDKPVGLVSVWEATGKTENETEEPSDWKFSLKNLEINDLLFTLDQPDASQRIEVGLENGNVSLNKLDLATREIQVRKVELKRPQIALYSDDSTETKVEQEPTLTSFSIPEFSWSVSTEKLIIKEGNFSYVISNNNEANELQKWLPLHDLNASLSDIRLMPTGYNFDLEKISFALSDKLKIKSGSVNFNTDSIQNIGLKLELAVLLNSDKKSWFAKDSLLSLTASISGSTEAVKIENTGLTSSSGLSFMIGGTIQQPLQLPNSACDLYFSSGTISRGQLSALVKHFSPQTILPGFHPFTVSGSIKNSFATPVFTLKMSSNSGNIKANGKYNLQNKSGELEASFSEIMLSQLLGEIYPQKLTGTLQLKGGLNGRKMPEGEAFIKIDSVLYKNKNTQNISLHALAENNKVAFTALAADSSVNFNFEGRFEKNGNNFYTAALKGNFYVDLFAMNLYAEPVSGKGKIDASVDYSNEGITTWAKLINFTIRNKKDTITIGKTEFELNSTDSLIDSHFESDFLSAVFNSHSSFTDFKNAFESTQLKTVFNLDSTNFLNLTALSNLEPFNFNATIRRDSVFELFLPDSVLNFSDIKIEIQKPDIKSITEATISTNWISNKAVKSFNPQLRARIENDRLSFNLNTDSIVAQEVKFGKSGINFEVLPSSIIGEFKVEDKNDSILHLIGFTAEREDESVFFKSSGSSWLINRVPWDLSPPLFLTFNKKTKTFSASLDLHSGEKRIGLTGNSSDKIELDVKNIELLNLAIPGLIGFVPDGKINANVKYSKNEHDNLELNLEILQMKWSNIQFERLAVAGHLVADSTGILDSKILISADDSLSLMVEMESNTSKNEFLVKSKFKKLHFQLFEPFISEYANHLHGTSSGEIILAKTGEKIEMNGEIGFNNFGLKIIPLKAWLTIPDNKIQIKQNQFIFNNFTVIDSLQRPLTVDGNIAFENSENIWADLKVNANKILVMNTSEHDNPEFFGSVIVNSGLNIKGSVFSPEINGNIDLESGTNLTYQLIQDLSVEQSQTDVVFALITDSMQIIYPITEKTKKATSMPRIETVIRIDPSSVFNVKISDLYDIEVSISGDGLLNYNMLPNNTMSLNGKYEIKSGFCKLKITGWPQKDFKITPGSSLRWNGSVENPELNLEATTRVKGSYLNPIDNKSRAVDFVVSMQLKNLLSELEIVFAIQSPDQYITSVLSSLSSDEIMRQAVNLLLFETIDLPGIESSSNYIASQMTSFWESQLNALTKTTFNKTALSFGIDTYNQSTTSGQQEKTSFTYEMERKFMNDRATVKLSGKLNDYNEGGAYQTNSIFENFIFEYALDKNDSKYLKLYQKKDYEDMLEGEVVKYGAGFLYRKNYKKMRDIWHREKKQKKNKTKK